MANQVKMYRIALTKKLDISGALDNEILTLIVEENIEDDMSETGIFRESIHQIVQIDEVLNAVEVENSGHTDKSISHYPSNSNSNSFTESLEAGKAKLPKIILKKFHGDPICLTPFWDSFRSAVDDNPCLSDVDKFNYLRNLLEGSATGAIPGLPLTAENYGGAKDISKKHFGQPQIIINAHMEGLVKVAAVTVDNDLKRLRFLYDRVEAQVRALQALGIQCESYGKLLLPLLMELPLSMRLISRAMDHRARCATFALENIICQSVKMPTVAVVPQKSSLEKAVWCHLLEENADPMRTRPLPPCMWTRTRQSCYKWSLLKSRGFISCILW